MRPAMRIVVGVLALTLAFIATPAFAGNAHFIGNHTTATGTGPDLVVKFKEAGLESGTIVDITLTADYQATFQCINGGKKNPNAANKSEEGGTLDTSAQFGPVPKNGNLTGSIPLAAPTTDSNDLECPNGQREQLSVIEWSNIVITDTTNDATYNVPGSFTYGELVD